MPSSLEEYDVLCTIGSGSYGTCKKIRRKKDGKLLVWKELDYGTMSELEKQMLVSEVNLLRELKHQNIVRYYDRIIDRSNTTLYIIMEFCQGGDLSSLISKMKREGRQVEEDFVWRVCVQTVAALKECHSRNKNGKTVLHRDLKPANIFLDAQGNVKLGDFGLARVLNHETSFARTFVGTPYYMSPEQMNYLSYNEKSDVWSLGCLLYELCALRPPFTAGNQKDLASKICTGRFKRIPMRFSNELNDIISHLLTVEEQRRPTIDSLVQHNLISKHTSPARDRNNSSTSDESGYDSKGESLRKKREAITSKENALEQRERELQLREKNLMLREKLAEERIIRAEKLMKEYQNKIASPHETTTPPSSEPVTRTPKLSSAGKGVERRFSSSPASPSSDHPCSRRHTTAANRNTTCQKHICLPKYFAAGGVVPPSSPRHRSIPPPPSSKSPALSSNILADIYTNNGAKPPTRKLIDWRKPLTQLNDAALV